MAPCAGRSSRTISMLGTDHIMAVAVKSLATANGSRAYGVEAIDCEAIV